MPAGAQIFNDYGTLLISDANPSLALKQKTALSSSGITFGSTSIANSEVPAVAWICDEGCYINSATWTGTTRNIVLNIRAGVASGKAATLYVFDRPVDSGANSGFQVRDSAGRITFDAMGKYGRVANVFAANGAFARVAGRSYAVMVTSSIYKDEILLDPINPSTHRLRRITITGGRVSATQVIIEDIIQSEISYPSSDTPGVLVNRGFASGVALDVTGY